MFNPKEHEQEFDNKKPSPGIHLLEFRWGKQTESKKGTPGFLCRADVVHGPEKGRSLFTTLWLTEASFGILASVCAAVGQEDGFDHLDEDQLKEALFYKAFKANVEINDNGYHEIKSFFARKRLDDESKAIIAELDKLGRPAADEFSDDGVDFDGADVDDEDIPF